MFSFFSRYQRRPAWNKGKLMGQKPPLKPKEIWAIRIRLQMCGETRDLALFNLAIDSKLRACDLLTIRVKDVFQGDRVMKRATILQQKTRQYARIVNRWVELVGLNKQTYGTHSLRRTKPSLIYHRTKNLRAIQLLLGHTKLESTVRYLGIEIDDALEMAEKTEL